MERKVSLLTLVIVVALCQRVANVRNWIINSRALLTIGNDEEAMKIDAGTNASKPPWGQHPVGQLPRNLKRAAGASSLQMNAHNAKVVVEEFSKDVAEAGLGGIAAAGIGVAMKLGLKMVEEGMTYCVCAGRWKEFMSEYPALIDNFVDAMRPSTHIWRGGTWNASAGGARSWTEAARALQRQVSRLQSPNIIDGNGLVDLDREDAMVKWCVGVDGAGMNGFISTMAMWTTGYHKWQLEQPDWWNDRIYHSIWGSYRHNAIWRVYTEALGESFRASDALAFRRACGVTCLRWVDGVLQSREVNRTVAGNGAHEYTWIQIAPFADTLPLQHFRRDSKAEYPPNMDNPSVLNTYYQPYFTSVSLKRQLILNKKRQYIHDVTDGHRSGRKFLADYDSFWSCDGSTDYRLSGDAVQFVIVAAKPPPPQAHGIGGRLATDPEVVTSHYINWNGDLVAWSGHDFFWMA